MRQRIIYKNPDGSISILIPAPDCGLTLEQIAAKDVPAGLRYKIVDVSELPQDRSERAAWTVDDAILTDGVGAAYGAGSENDVIGWAANGQPITRRRRQPPTPPAVEAPRPTPIKIRPPQI